MTNIIAKTTGLSLLALAAIPFLALSVARAEPASIKVSDLDLARPAHMATFQQRVERAADKFCAGYAVAQNLSARAACEDGVRAEAMDKVARHQVDAIITTASR